MLRRYLYLVLILWLLAVPTVAQARSHRFLRLDIEAQVGKLPKQTQLSRPRQGKHLRIRNWFQKGL